MTILEARDRIGGRVGSLESGRQVPPDIHKKVHQSSHLGHLVDM